MTSVEDEKRKNTVPQEFTLFQNYPNPFNTETNIMFKLPSPMPVTINIYNILGQVVRKLVDGIQAVGSHTIIWDGRNDSGLSVPGGVYFFELKGKNKKTVKKMVLLR